MLDCRRRGALCILFLLNSLSEHIISDYSHANRSVTADYDDDVPRNSNFAKKGAKLMADWVRRVANFGNSSLSHDSDDGGDEYGASSRGSDVDSSHNESDSETYTPSEQASLKRKQKSRIRPMSRFSRNRSPMNRNTSRGRRSNSTGRLSARRNTRNFRGFTPKNSTFNSAANRSRNNSGISRNRGRLPRKPMRNSRLNRLTMSGRPSSSRPSINSRKPMRNSRLNRLTMSGRPSSSKTAINSRKPMRNSRLNRLTMSGRPSSSKTAINSRKPIRNSRLNRLTMSGRPSSSRPPINSGKPIRNSRLNRLTMSGRPSSSTAAINSRKPIRNSKLNRLTMSGRPSSSRPSINSRKPMRNSRLNRLTMSGRPSSSRPSINSRKPMRNSRLNRLTMSGRPSSSRPSINSRKPMRNSRLNRLTMSGIPSNLNASINLKKTTQSLNRNRSARPRSNRKVTGLVYTAPKPVASLKAPKRVALTRNSSNSKASLKNQTKIITLASEILKNSASKLGNSPQKPLKAPSATKKLIRQSPSAGNIKSASNRRVNPKLNINRNLSRTRATKPRYLKNRSITSISTRPKDLQAATPMQTRAQPSYLQSINSSIVRFAKSLGDKLRDRKLTIKRDFDLSLKVESTRT